MRYKKVKPECDNMRLFKIKHNKLIISDFLIGNELFTLKEWQKILDSHYVNNRLLDAVEDVEINKNDTYFFFGARFSN